MKTALICVVVALLVVESLAKKPTFGE